MCTQINLPGDAQILQVFRKPTHHYGEVIMNAMASQITGVSIAQPFVRAQIKKIHQSSASLAFERGIHWWPLDSLHKGPVTQKIFPFDDVIMLWHSLTRYACARLAKHYILIAWVSDLDSFPYVHHFEKAHCDYFTWKKYHDYNKVKFYSIIADFFFITDMISNQEPIVKIAMAWD